MVWMSGKDRSRIESNVSLPLSSTLQPVGHANFKLKKKGGSLFIIAPNGDTVDHIHYSKQFPDHSFGRTSDSDNQWSYFLTPTSGTPNVGRPLRQIIKEPIFYPLPSIVSEQAQIHLNIESVEPVDIRYTTDGREPDEKSLLYQHPIKISKSVTFRTAAFMGKERVSPIATGTYYFDSNPQLPILAVTLKPEEFNEVHLNIRGSGIESERQAYWEYFDTSGKRIEATGFGLRLHGGAGRNGDLRTKKSYRAYFRKIYGDGRLNGKVIPDASVKNFDKLVLRASSNDRAPHGSSIRDQVIRDLHLDMGGVAAHGSWCVLLINSVNRGVYNVTERMDQEFLASHLGPGQFDVIKTGETVLNGNRQEWNRLKDFVRKTHFSDQRNYEALKRRVDIENFTSYVILNLCMQNFDWPNNNWYAARRVPDGRWIFMCWDSEWGLGYRHPHSGDAPVGIDLDPYAFIDSGGAYGNGLIRSLYLALISNQDYRQYYQQEVRRFLKGSLSTENIIRQIHRHRDAIEVDLGKEYKARGRPIKQWHHQIAEMEHFARNCTSLFQRFTDEYFGPVSTFDESHQVALVESHYGKRHIFYRNQGGHLGQLTSSADGGPWKEDKIAMPTSAPSSIGNPAAYSLTSGKMGILYRGPEGSLHELSYLKNENKLGQWIHTDLSSILSLPPAGRDPSVVVTGEKPHVFYLDKNSHPHEVWLNRIWRHHPLPVAPRPGGDISVTSTPGALHVTYRTMFGVPCDQRLELNEAVDGQRPWRHQLVHQIPALGQPVGLMTGGKWRVIFKPATEWPRREPYIFHWDGPEGKGYQEYKGSRIGLIVARKQRHRFHHLEQIGTPSKPADGNPIVLNDADTDRQYVAYRDTEGHIQQASLIQNPKSEKWQIQDLTNLSQAPTAVGDPIGLLGNKGSQRCYVYTGSDGRLHELRFDGQWSHIELGVSASKN